MGSFHIQQIEYSSFHLHQIDLKTFLLIKTSVTLFPHKLIPVFCPIMNNYEDN
jgi:hypothetical protein